MHFELFSYVTFKVFFPFLFCLELIKSLFRLNLRELTFDLIFGNIVDRKLESADQSITMFFPCLTSSTVLSKIYSYVFRRAISMNEFLFLCSKNDLGRLNPGRQTGLYCRSSFSRMNQERGFGWRLLGTSSLSSVRKFIVLGYIIILLYQNLI